MLGIGPNGPEQLPDDHPMAGHFDVYQWLTVMQEYLVLALMDGATVTDRLHGAITDVGGILVGHHHALDDDADLRLGMGHRNHRGPARRRNRRRPSKSAAARPAHGRPISSTPPTRSATSTQCC